PARNAAGLLSLRDARPSGAVAPRGSVVETKLSGLSRFANNILGHTQHPRQRAENVGGPNRGVDAAGARPSRLHQSAFRRLNPPLGLDVLRHLGPLRARDGSRSGGGAKTRPNLARRTNMS